jgi:hypothetical protein
LQLLVLCDGGLYCELGIQVSQFERLVGHWASLVPVDPALDLRLLIEVAIFAGDGLLDKLLGDWAMECFDHVFNLLLAAG